MLKRKVLQHNELGIVVVTFKPNARHFIARWQANHLSLTAPVLARDSDVSAAINRLLPQLLVAKNNLSQFIKFHERQEIRLDGGLTISIVRQSLQPADVSVSQHSIQSATVFVGSDLDFDDARTSQYISKALKVVAKKNAERLLLPRAQLLADKFGCNPIEWKISSGSSILGQCNAKRGIKLSYMLVFLPDDLREYVICHELAHLSELNHSQRFHHICDTYLGGREKELIRKLKTYRWPLIRK